jgi:hypothetical protein
MAEINSAAALAQASGVMKVETLSFPGFGGKGDDFGFDPTKYRVRYGKYDLDDLGAVTELELVETRGLAGKEIVVLNKDKMSFMDKMYLILTYLELIEEV